MRGDFYYRDENGRIIYPSRFLPLTEGEALQQIPTPWVGGPLSDEERGDGNGSAVAAAALLGFVLFLTLLVAAVVVLAWVTAT